jgi:hypothetical protein
MKLQQLNENTLLVSIKRPMIRFLGVILILGSIVPALYLMTQYQIVCKDKQPNRAAECTLESSVYSLYHTTTPLGTLKKSRCRE